MASIIASVVLAIGTVIADLAIKQIVLSGTARESLNALYAADTGTECALFLDFRYNDSTQAAFNPSPAVCNGQTFSISPAAYTDTEGTWMRSTFRVTLVNGDSAGACADVIVDKRAPVAGEIKTRLQARGYNICAGGGRRVERALQVEY
ncbi:MAG TPA: hypothetical protein VD967_03615 [Candidatus Paceibacterota bacterium]|nr:hypothetical protein [Candidatus Paceibacterota bacterium]